MCHTSTSLDMETFFSSGTPLLIDCGERGDSAQVSGEKRWRGWEECGDTYGSRSVSQILTEQGLCFTQAPL